MRIFIGVDPRDAVSYNVLHWSIVRRASRPVSICPLILPQLPITRTGLTHFTFSRYLVPQLCGYHGVGLFLDSDMLCLADIVELFQFPFGGEAVALVKNPQRFEWASLMLFNNSLCRKLTKDVVNDPDSNPQDLTWADKIAELPPEWNHCVGYDAPREDARIVHFTSGTPGFAERARCEYAQAWRDEYESMTSQAPWLEVHGRSIHAPKVLEEINQRIEAFR